MPSIGQAQGMAVDLGYGQQQQDLRYQQQMQNQQNALNDAKRRLFESDIEYQQGGNAFDQPIVKKVNQEITQQIGDYVASNPDWETSFQKRAYVKQLKNSLKDNPDVLRAMATNENRNALLKYAQEAKQKGVPFDEDALNQELERYSNYEKFGNPDGPEATQNEGAKAYLFSRPQDFVDMDNVYKEAGSSIKNPEIIATGNGGYYTKPKEEDVDARVNSILQSHGNQLMKQFSKQGITDPNEIKKLVKQNVIASFDSDFKLGDSLRAWELGMRQKEHNLKMKEAADKVGQGNYTPWHYFVDEKNNPSGTIDKATFDKVWGGVNPGFVKGNDGFKADLTGLDFKSSGRYVNQHGRTFINGYVDMTIDDAIERGIYKGGKLTWDEVKPNFTGIAKETTIQDKEGNDMKIVRVNYDMPINKDDKVAMQKFNIVTDVDKHVPGINSPNEESFYSRKSFDIGGQKVFSGARFKNPKTGQEGILQDDGTIKPL